MVSYVAYAPPWSVTDDDRRRQTPESKTVTNIYIAPKSTNESGCITTPEAVGAFLLRVSFRHLVCVVDARRFNRHIVVVHVLRRLCTINNTCHGAQRTSIPNRTTVRVP